MFKVEIIHILFKLLGAKFSWGGVLVDGVGLLFLVLLLLFVLFGLLLAGTFTDAFLIIKDLFLLPTVFLRRGLLSSLELGVVAGFRLGTGETLAVRCGGEGMDLRLRVCSEPLVVRS